jgi:hypothetical protein
MALVDSPHCRLHLDVKAMSSEGTTNHRHYPVATRNIPFISTQMTRTGAGPEWGRSTSYRFWRTLQEVNYQGWISVEVFDYAPGVEALATKALKT